LRRICREHAFILAGDRITPDLLPLASSKSPPPSHETFQVEVGQRLAEVERELILRTLARYGGDKQRAADVLGISVRTIYNRLRAYAREP
jgi:DNA-binding NtrC family response regulator